jgi:hypothetical protein
MEREEWLASNPALREDLDAVSRSVSQTWSRTLDDNVAYCLHCVYRSPNRTPVLRSHWKKLMRSIQSVVRYLFSELRSLAVANHALISHYPGNWMDDVVRQILKDQLIWKDGRNVVDVWAAAVAEVEGDSQSTLTHLYGTMDVDVNEARSMLRNWVWRAIEIELLSFDEDSPLSAAHVEFEEIWQLPKASDRISTTRFETEVSLTEPPTLTLGDLRDPKRHRQVICEVYPRLVNEIDQVLRAPGLDTEDIRDQSMLLRELSATELSALLANQMNWPAASWAVTVIQVRTGKSVGTIQRYGQPSGCRF